MNGDISLFSDRFYDYLKMEFHYNSKNLQPQVFFQLPLENKVKVSVNGLLALRMNIFF